MGCSLMFKILIIDPNHPFRRSLKKVLAHRFPFVDIREASNGSEGSQLVQSFRPDLIFLEIHLTSERGLDLARRIKSDHPEIIIVLLTSYDLPEYHAAAEESGAEHLVPKDEWTGEDMLDLVDRILTDRKADDQGLRNGQRPLEQSS
jgi:CheY-like chemotaxis protein